MYFENLVALHIAIEKQCTQELAFKYLDKFAEGVFDIKPVFKWSLEDIEDIKKFKKEGLTYKEIAEIYFTTEQAIYRTFKRDKKRAAEAAKIKKLKKYSKTVYERLGDL